MIPNATLTVAIACYNQGQFLDQAIDSVLSQTRYPDALIVVDDGSNDSTAIVASRYTQIIYHHQRNAGLSAARNKGLMLTTTQRILFLDADDRLTPNALADGMRRMDEILGAAFVYGGFREIDETGRLMREQLPTPKQDEFEALLRGNHIAMHGTVIYDTHRLREAGGFDKGLKSTEDYDVYLRLARNHPIGSYATIAAEYRRHGLNMTAKPVTMIRTARQVIHRQMSDGLTPEQRRSARIGLHFMTDYYGDAAAEKWAGLVRSHRWADALRFGLAWFFSDPSCMSRLFRRLARKLKH